MMTNSLDFSNCHYPTEWLNSVCSTNHSLFIPLSDNPNFEAESLRTFFFPSAGALYALHPSERRKSLNRAAGKLEASRLPWFRVRYFVSLQQIPQQPLDILNQSNGQDSLFFFVVFQWIRP
ncbi:MAG: hypothetical protein PHI97_27260 [Desulfobulbus sp.]|nr:hypothetical protein [Desulfobulbus sp.]